MGQVIKERITNKRIRKIFFNTPTVENTIVIRQMNYLGKIVRGPTNHPPRQMLTAWSANPCPTGGVLMTNRKVLTAYPLTQRNGRDNHNKKQNKRQTHNKTHTHKGGILKLWIKIPEDKKLWN